MFISDVDVHRIGHGSNMGFGSMVGGVSRPKILDRFGTAGIQVAGYIGIIVSVRLDKMGRG